MILCGNTGQHGMRKRYNRISDSRLEPSKFQLLISQYETKIEQYGRLKSQIESFSKDYDSELSRIHWRIREISDKIDIVVMFRKGEFANELISDVIAQGAKTLWLQLGITNENARQIAMQNGINFVQNKCIMVEYKNLKGWK